MSKVPARLAALSLGLVLAGTTGATVALLLPPNPVSAYLHFAKEQVFPGTETRLREEGPARNAKVLEALAQLGEHAWAGVYRTKGLYPVELVIAPGAGYTLYQSSSCGVCARYVGTGGVLAEEGSVLKLQIELEEPDDTSAAWYGLDATLHLVRWGELLFAVPEGRMESFCAEVADGYTFPHVPFRCAGEPGDLEDLPRPTGKPQVPSEFQHLLLDEPIACRVLALVEWRRQPDLDGEDQRAYDALYSIDAGSDDGLAVGMRLSVDGEPRWGRFTGRVESVDRNAGRFQWLVFEERRDWATGLVGKRATTLHPKAPAR